MPTKTLPLPIDFHKTLATKILSKTLTPPLPKLSRRDEERSCIIWRVALEPKAQIPATLFGIRDGQVPNDQT
jgi:hypothetical protein